MLGTLTAKHHLLLVSDVRWANMVRCWSATNSGVGFTVANSLIILKYHCDDCIDNCENKNSFGSFVSPAINIYCK